MLFCADCGHVMYQQRYQNKNRKQDCYICGSYKKRTRDCTAHFIRTDLLTAGVLSNLRQVTEYAARHESRFVKLLIQQNEIGGKRKTAAATKQLEQAQERIAEVSRIIKRLYEDNVNGKISDERFMELSADYEQEQRELKDRTAALQAELDKSQAATVNAEKFMGIVRKHLAFEELTPTLLREMIEKIVVHECSYDENGTRRQDIESLTPDLSDTMAKCRIGTAKFFTLLLLLYRTSAKTEGSVTYTIKRNSYVTPVPQQINPVQWTGTTPYYGPNQNSHTVISSVEGIKVGATVKMTLRLSQDQSDAADDSFDGLVITGAKIISKTESFNVYPILGNNNHYAAREYVLEITDKDVIISGQLEVNQSHDQNSTFYIDFKLLKEPSSIYIPSDTDEPTDSGETVGTVTVDYDSIVAAEFTDENIKATVGSTPWSVVINKLPGSDGTNTYTYYVEEEVAASDEFENVSITPSQGTPVGGKVQVVNKLKSGELKVKKAVAGAAPADKTYEIAVRDAEGNYFGTDGTNYGQIPHYETFRANDEKIWTPLTPGKFTVSEKDASVAGYTWTVSGTGDITVVQGDTAETTVTNSYFKNTEYTPKVTKSLMVGNEEVTSWPDGVSFDFYLSFVEGYQGSGSDKVVLSRNDIVMSNREATATEDSKTAIFERREKDSESETETVQPGITFKKPGTYVFTIEEVEPAGTQNHKRNGIVYSTEKVTLTVVVGEKSGDPGVLEVVRKTYSRANGQTDDALGGLITNTLDYPSYAPSVAKSLKDGEAEASTEVWNGKSFTFNLAIASSMTNELKANVIMPNTAEKTVNKDSTDHKETFDAISFKAEGTYTFTMTESIPGDATNAEGKKYSEASEEEKAAGGFKYNSVEYVAGPKTIDVMVESDEDGNLSVTKVTIDGTEVTGESIIGSGATFENKLVQNGALRLTKVVKYKDNAPTADEYQYVDGDFIFKVSRTVDEEGGTPEVVKYVQITVSDGQASSYKIANSETELAEATSHKGQYALITDLPAGDYTIEEVGRNGLMLVSFVRGDNDNSSVDVEKETVTVHVSESDSAAENTNAQATFTNNYFDNDGPDKITLDIIKTFSGISSLGDVPDGTDGFEVVVGYNLKGEEKTITLKKDQDETIADGGGRPLPGRFLYP